MRNKMKQCIEMTIRLLFRKGTLLIVAANTKEWSSWLAEETTNIMKDSTSTPHSNNLYVGRILT